MRELIVIIINIDFILLLTASTAIMMSLYSPQSNFKVRLPVGAVIIIAGTTAATLISVLTNSYTSENFAQLSTTSLVFIIMFLSLFCAVKLCFKGSVSSILLSCITAYAMKQLAEEFFYLLSFIPNFPNFTTMTATTLVATLISYYAIQFTVYAVIYCAVYFLIIRNYRKRINTGETKPAILICALIAILICSTFNIIRNTFADESLTLNILCMIYDLLCCALVIFIRLGVFEKDTYEQEVITMQGVWKEKENQLELFRNTVDDINVKHHDLKRSLSLLRKENEKFADQLIGEIEQTLETYDSKAETGNTTLDTILTQYNLQCKKNGIRLSIIADGTLLSFMSSTDTVAFIGNILENAVEAVLKLSEENRTISFSVTQSMGLISVREENPYKDEISFKNGLPLTSKGDNKYHGFGMKSIQMILNKYGGTMSIDSSEGVFRFNILFEIIKQ